MKQFEIHLQDRPIGTVKIGCVRGRETWMFTYAPSYLNAANPMMDPDIANVSGPQFPRGGAGFGFLSDVAPDRWGRKLIRRRERRALQESDYILGVCDLTRQGAVRIKAEPGGPFEAADVENAAPPWTTLRKLEDSARHLDADDGGADEERWLNDLFRPGSSLGGARPKANVTAPDGSLWIAKFPSARDERDVGRLEYETSVLARRLGLNVPETKCRKLSKAGTTFFSKRFDREGTRRIHYASAMTMLGAADGEGDHGYLEIAEWLSQNGAAPEADLKELWRRMVFSHFIGNTDDHLRNHGFLLTSGGWRLAPMFDVNPNPDGGEHALDLGDPIRDADYYRLTQADARSQYGEIRRAAGAMACSALRMVGKACVLAAVMAFNALAAPQPAVIPSEGFPSISAAVAACAERGGGVVTVAKGEHLSRGPVVMRSNVELRLEDGATILFSDDVKDYLPGVPVSWEGIECVNVSPLVYAYGCTNVAITGRGTLKAKMDFWWTWAGVRKPDCEAVNRKLKNEWSPKRVPVAERQLWREPNARFRPQFIHFNRCRGVRLEGFAIRGTPFWTVHFLLCDGVVARNLDIDARGDDGRMINNSDGIDVDATRNVLIEGCSFSQGDDALVFKSGKDFDGRRLATPTENVVVRNCTVRRGHNLAAFGSELSGGIRNVRISGCRILDTVGEVVFIKSNPRRGGFVEDITLEDIETAELRRNVCGLSARYYFGASGEEAFPEDYRTPIRNITIRNVRCPKARERIRLCGDYLLPVENFTLENVVVDRLSGDDYVANVRNLLIDGKPVEPTVATATADALGDLSAAVWQPETREYVLALTDGTVRGTVLRRSRDRKLWSEPVPALNVEERHAQAKASDVRLRRAPDGWIMEITLDAERRSFFTSELFWPFCPRGDAD